MSKERDILKKSRGLQLVSGLAFSILLMGFYAGAVNAEDSTPPAITDIQMVSNIRYITIDWRTDEKTSGKVDYGTSSGTYSSAVDAQTIESGLRHTIQIGPLAFNQQWFLRISATDLSGNVSSAQELTYTTPPEEIRVEEVKVVDVGPDTGVLSIRYNRGSHQGFRIHYGVVSGSYPNEVPYYYENIIPELKPKTTYFFVLKPPVGYDPIQGTFIEHPQEYSFTTTAAPEIVSIKPDRGPVGTIVRVIGENLGRDTQLKNQRLVIATGCPITIDGKTSCGADVVSWTDTEVVLRVNEHAKTGPISILKGYLLTGGTKEFLQVLVTAQGPVFTATGAGGETQKPPGQQLEQADVVESMFGCSISTTARDVKIIQVPTLFNVGSENYRYLQNIRDAYLGQWGREPRCDELQFHLDHGTTIERLTEWLKGQVITEKFGCTISTTSIGTGLIHINSSLTLGNDADRYLTSVSQAYEKAWSRLPRCDELQFHLDHSTPLDRLAVWLDEHELGTEATDITPRQEVPVKTPMSPKAWATAAGVLLIVAILAITQKRRFSK